MVSGFQGSSVLGRKGCGLLSLQALFVLVVFCVFVISFFFFWGGGGK